MTRRAETDERRLDPTTNPHRRNLPAGFSDRHSFVPFPARTLVLVTFTIGDALLISRNARLAIAGVAERNTLTLFWSFFVPNFARVALHMSL